MFTSRQTSSTVWRSSALRRSRMISSVVCLFFFILGSGLAPEPNLHNGPVLGGQISKSADLQAPSSHRPITSLPSRRQRLLIKTSFGAVPIASRRGTRQTIHFRLRIFGISRFCALFAHHQNPQLSEPPLNSLTINGPMVGFEPTT